MPFPKFRNAHGFSKAIRALPFVFFIHHLEEIFFLHQWMNEPPFPLLSFIKRLDTPIHLYVASFLLGISGFWVVFISHRYLGEQNYFRLMAAFTGMVLLNVFFPHILFTFYFLHYTPGIFTAVNFNLPLTSFIFACFFIYKLLPKKEVIFFCGLGGASGLILYFVFLKASILVEFLI